ncbi:hypothetical protein N836_19875 [Leptolyngbya sp. Heron Island J]|nr:hypothetical protein N836_19875 [Leptolyngbya sp. Heron Island J]
MDYPKSFEALVSLCRLGCEDEDLLYCFCTIFCANSTEAFNTNSFWRLIFTENQAKTAPCILDMAKI